MIHWGRLLWALGCLLVVWPAQAREQEREVLADQIPVINVPRFAGDMAREDQDLSRQMVWHEDPQHQLGLAGARQLARWRLADGAALRPGVSRSAFWLQLRLANPTLQERRVVVHFGGARQDYMDWYVLDPAGTELARGHMGDRLPMAVRAVPTRGLAAPVTLPPGATRLLYVRATSHDGWNAILRPVLDSETLFYEHSLREDHLRGFLFGVLLTFGVLGLWWYTATGHRSGLYFTGYAVTAISYAMSEMAYDLAYLWPNQPVWHKHFVVYSGAAAALFYTVFVASFLRLETNAPRWVNRLLLALGGLGLLSVVPVMFDRYALAVQTTLVLPVLLVVAALVAVWMALRRVRGAAYMVAGFVLQNAILSFTVLRYMGVLPQAPFDQSLLFYGMAANILLIATGLARSLQHWRAERLEAKASARKAQEALRARQDHAARHDPLTGLPNRLALDEWLTARITDPHPFALLHLGLAGFKRVVDQHGDVVADQAQLEVGRRCAALMGANDFLAHTLDDEFVLALHGADATQARGMASVLVSRLGQPVLLDSGAMTLQPRIGIAIWPTDASEPAALRQCAMLALQDTGDGASAVQGYRQGSDQARARRNTLLRDLMRAPGAGQLQLHYQPKLDARTGRVVTAEALMRWQHPELGVVSPAEFIGLAERAGLMHELTQWALAQAVGQMARWRDAGLALELSVNLSVLDLQHRRLPEQLAQLLADKGVPAQALTLEITETSVLHESDTVRRVLSDLCDLGVALSIDDFGTGYSSLSMLKRLPLAELKIDQSFIHPLALADADDHHAAIVRATTQMGHAMGLRVVCEGVETAAVAERLKAWGCDALQGYWLSRPLPAEALAAWLTQRQAT